jgi:hypothetical protein
MADGRRLGVARLTACVAVLLLSSCAAQSAPDTGLVLERTISLGTVKGRIDHLAIDIERRRLFVAELGNGSVAAVDLGEGQVWRRIEGQREPQGLAYVPGADLLFIASAGDGSLQRLAAADLTPAGTTNLGSDADNIRVYGADKIVVGPRRRGACGN